MTCWTGLELAAQLPSPRGEAAMPTPEGNLKAGDDAEIGHGGGKRGGAVATVMKTFGVDSDKAVEMLAERYGDLDAVLKSKK